MKNLTVGKDLDPAISNENITIVSDDYSKLVIEKMTKQVEDRLVSLKAFSPLLLTIITSLLAYLMTQSFPNDLSWFIFIIVGYLLICLASIFMAYFPKKYYISDATKKVNRFYVVFKLQANFEPWNIASYIGLSDADFIIKLQDFLDKELSCEELLLAHFLKQKTNEYAYKRQLMSLSYIVIILGAVVIGVGCVVIGFPYIFKS